MENFKKYSLELFRYIKKSHSVFHAVDALKEQLEQAGFLRLCENERWKIDAGGKYYVERGMSSIVAFCVPKKDFGAFSIIAPHSDSPCFRIKENPEMHVDGKYTKLNTEVYGGMRLSLWLDRALGAAGRVLVRTKNGVEAHLVNINRNFVIPSLAIHMDRDANDGKKVNAAKETLPLFSEEKGSFLKLLSESVSCEVDDIMSYDIFLYNTDEGKFHGANEEFISAPKLDDLQCTYSAAKALISSENEENVTVCAVFDNEEIGSLTKQGADSTLLSDVLSRISASCGKDEESYRIALAKSIMLSADNAHAVHPLYPEIADYTSRCYLNAGIVIKNSTSYTTDAMSAAIFKQICRRAGIPYQIYFNRSDMRGGSTLGNISNSHVSITTLDIGIPQLAMHSPYETAGIKDTFYMVTAMAAFYKSVVIPKENYGYEIKL